jgi:serine/threonine-protein kinase RsbW
MPADDPPAADGLGDAPPGVHLVIRSDPDAVREGLRALFDSLLTRGLHPEDRATAELVLAEVLNNVVEHAYAAEAGEIAVTLRLGPAGLRCTVVDSGRPMPQGLLPDAHAPEVTGPEASDLPEGGFGWFLIRSLSQDLCYRREEGRNQLCFRLATDAAPQMLGIPGDGH